MWDCQSEKKAEFRVHRVNFFNYVPVAIHNIAFDEKTDKLALSRANGSIEIYDARNGWLQEKIFPPCEDQSVEALLWCQGHLLSAGLHGNILQHDLLSLTTKKRTSSNSGAVWCMTANHDDTQIAAGTEDGCVALFNVTEEGVEYSRALDKQEGRILCIAWYSGEESLIVTGGMDNIRIWSAKSGHAIQRITLGRQHKHKETIVWAIAIAKNFTIVSGDSRGKTCFWDGKTGTPIKTFSMQETDILTIAVGKTGKEVYCAGVHPSVVMYQWVEGDKGQPTWVRSVVDTRHTRDVRAIAVTRHGVVSGGVDCSLVFNTRTDKMKTGVKWRKLPFVPMMTSLACAAKEANMLLLQYPEYLELWRLGKTSVDSEKSGDILPLREKPLKLVQLKSRDGAIVCSTINSQGTWIAYSDQEVIRMFNLEIEEVEFEAPRLSMRKVKVPTAKIQPAHKMIFTPDGKTLVAATCTGSVQLINVSDSEPVLQHTFYVEPEQASGIHLLAVSTDSNYFAFGDHNCHVRVYNIEKKQHAGSLPKYTHQPTALCFHPKKKEILVMYADRKLQEYDYSAQEYTAWSRKINNNWHPNWLYQPNKITHLTYNLQNPVQIIMAHESMLCVLDKRKPLPTSQIPLFEKEKWYSQQHMPTDHAFHFSSAYKLILHMEMVSEDFLLIVEKPPISILDQLPPALNQKKFGT